MEDDDKGGLINTVFDYEGFDSDCEWASNRQDNLHPSEPTEQRPKPPKVINALQYTTIYSMENLYTAFAYILQDTP